MAGQSRFAPQDCTVIRTLALRLLLGSQVSVLTSAQRADPIIVKIVEQPNSDPTGLADVLIKTLGLIGVLVLIAVLFGIVTAGLMFWFRSRQTSSDADV
jgi:hypothetical protein